MSEDALLFLHLSGAFLFVGGSLVALVLRIAALRRDDPREIAVLLRAVRPAVPLVIVGLATTVGFGAWLAHRLGYSYGATWLSATFGLLAWMLVVGGPVGRQDRRTRELAERLAADGDTGGGDADELRRRLRAPANLGLNGSMLLATAAIVALMVWKP